MTPKNNVIGMAMPLLLPAVQAADSQSPIPWWVWIVLILLALLVMMIILIRQQGPGEPIPSPEEQIKKVQDKAVPATRTAALSVEPPTEEPAEAETEPSSTTAEEAEEEAPPVDDLTRIEGIGPKTASLFKEAGITTFAKLAGSDLTVLDKILDDANMHFADESSWPEQAKLADEGKWDELEKLQAKLKGGRRT